MAEAIASDLASALVLKLVSLASNEVIQAWNVYKDLTTLREKLESIDALLLDAQIKKLTMSAVQNWFNKLEAVAHVTDSFMDELEYEVTRQKVENRHKVRDFFIPSKNSLLYRLKVAHKIKSIYTSFDKIFKWAGDLGLKPVAHLSSVVQPRHVRKTPPSEEESLLVGRDNDISFLVQTVCKIHAEDLPVIAILGMGGQGKTTLARMVYNREAVTDMFPKRMWVSVSDDFDFMKILNQMVVSLTSTASVLENTEGLIKRLQKNLKGEKFLLVLDDIWNEKPEEWDNLRNSLLEVGGARGSNIVITTRNQEVVDAIRCSVSYRVEKLSEEDSYQLFKKRAFSHGGVLETEAFAVLGRRMVQRCGGLPLAIKTLGGLLHSKKSEQAWLQIQNSEIWKSKGVLSSLRLSYDNLPLPLKRCFVYCSIMPKDFDIYKDELVQIWMALGFLLPPRGSNMLMEDIGNEYFNILLWNSLLQDIKKDKFGNITSCKMHDLVHDLALELSRHHSVTVKANHVMNHISDARYVRLDKGVSDIKTRILKQNFERVQVLYGGARILGDVLPYIKHLTVLVLNTGEVITELPNSLYKMKYLKHLDISCYRNRLPSHITKLYNLQTLRVWELDELPKKFFKLIKLRHLFIKKAYDKTRCTFVGIESLTCLQTLPHFVVRRDQNCLIGHLRELENLRGKLELYGLGDVENLEEASKARLCTKSNIQCLVLDWSNNEDEREDIEYNDKDVMKGLKPDTNLKELTIANFKGKRFASWITLMTNLVKITLRDCKICEEFPQLGHLPKLREMEIRSMNIVKVIGSRTSEFSKNGTSRTVTTMFPSLTNLRLWNLPKLEEWLEPVMSTDHENQSTVIVFPKLEVLRINSCSKLTNIMSSYLSSLKKLIMHNLDCITILEKLSRNVSSLTYLSMLNISNGGGGGSSSLNMDSIIGEFLKNNSSSLTTMKLYDCPGLTSLILGVALKQLVVSNCPDLTSINVTEESRGLKYLTVERCPSLLALAFLQSVSSTLVQFSFAPRSEELDIFPWPFSFSSAISFPNLISLTLFGWEKVKSILPEGQIDDRLFSTFPALSHLCIINFQGVKALQDSIAKLPALKTFLIWQYVERRVEQNGSRFNIFHVYLGTDELFTTFLPVIFKVRGGEKAISVQHSHILKNNFINFPPTQQRELSLINIVFGNNIAQLSLINIVFGNSIAELEFSSFVFMCYSSPRFWWGNSHEAKVDVEFKNYGKLATRKQGEVRPTSILTYRSVVLFEAQKKAKAQKEKAGSDVYVLQRRAESGLYSKLKKNRKYNTTTLAQAQTINAETSSIKWVGSTVLRMEPKKTLSSLTLCIKRLIYIWTEAPGYWCWRG
ncbi:putative disease resistance protein RGA3 [Heracleum sosnowskyi]|uniref:Disease resistance protein RGA3 n=1 Tax=Heracleum sosnowskyi TaxID=360622 RepID=A0AAD8HBX2_9APIA|nr:putative disease resistance protein RGA3 [Heracleum sosnowskyi]